MESLRYLGRIRQKKKEDTISSVNRKQRPEATEVSAASNINSTVLLVISVILCTVLLSSIILITIRVRNNRGQNMKNYLQSQDRSAYSQYIIDNTPQVIRTPSCTAAFHHKNILSITEDMARRKEERKVSYMFV